MSVNVRTGPGVDDVGRLRARPISPRAVVLASILALLVGTGVYVVAGYWTGAPRTRPLGQRARTDLSRVPLALQGVLSGRLGANSRTYKIQGSGESVRAANPAQHLQASFRPSGVRVVSGGAEARLGLRAVGFGSSLSSVGPGRLSASGNRVTYARNGLKEWYSNGPLGLEQGFTILRAPVRSAAEPLTLVLGLSGNVRATLAGDARSITLSHSGRPVLRYTGLNVRDARGHLLHAWMTLGAGQIKLHAQTRGAHYPLYVDPFVQQGGKLTGSGETGKGYFGWSVALSSDGNTALVGGRVDNSLVGAVWVFTRSGEEWSQQGEKLTGGGEAGAAQFGGSVALSSDGNTALIGGADDNTVKGAAWVFTREAGKWSQQGEKLTAGDETGQGAFGLSVALSSDGNTALIGGVYDNSKVGAAWVFTREAGKWAQQGEKLTGEGESGKGEFGASVGLSSDGNTALIGGYADNSNIGAAWVFTREAGKWAQQGEKLTGAGESGKASFGFSVTLSSDGNTALIGGEVDENPVVGAVWAFTREAGKWSQQGEKLTPSGASTAYFGWTVALSSTGDKALIGAPTAGAAWVFTRAAGKWTQQGERYSVAEVSGTGFGVSVALSSDGNTAMVGGYADQEQIGAAWAFGPQAPAVTTESAADVTTSDATLHAMVNPNREEVSECVFEYGTTASYGSSAPCSSSPGSGGSAVAVSAALTGLSLDTTYHFRISATSAQGTHAGADVTFTTLETGATDETTEPTVPAEAADGGISVEASGGTGRITVGHYGTDIGGAAVLSSHGRYFQIYHSEGASFKTIQYHDCELEGAKTLWWENPATGWEPIPEPTAVYTESPTPCITVTATVSTTPSIAQLSDPRHVGGPTADVEFGKCLPAKHGYFSDAACLSESVNKAGAPKGKYEWDPALYLGPKHPAEPPVDCYPLKHGHFADGGCTKESYKENKKTHERKYKGAYERKQNTYARSGGAVTVQGEGLGTLECPASSSQGAFRAGNSAVETITFTGCERGGTKCASAHQSAGMIVSEPLESYTYYEKEYLLALAGKSSEEGTSPNGGSGAIMTFSCASATFTLGGAVAGKLGAALNTPISSSGATFGEQAKQELDIVDALGHVYAAVLTTNFTTSYSDPVELRVP